MAEEFIPAILIYIFKYAIAVISTKYFIVFLNLKSIKIFNFFVLPFKVSDTIYMKGKILLIFLVKA